MCEREGGRESESEVVNCKKMEHLNGWESCFCAKVKGDKCQCMIGYTVTSKS